MCKVLTARSSVREHQKLQPVSACKSNAALISSGLNATRFSARHGLRAAVLTIGLCMTALVAMLQSFPAVCLWVFLP
jgi:hypothetical protein